MDRAASGDSTVQPLSVDPPKRSPLSRISFGHVLMVLAGLFAVIFNLLLLRGGEIEDSVVVAERALPAGTRVTAEDFAFVSAPVDGSLAERFVIEERVGELIGLVMSRSVAAGDPVFIDDVRPEAAPDAGRAMSVPIEPNQAVAGALTRGDRIDIVSVVDGVSRFIVTGAEVLAVPASADGRLGTSTVGDWSVTIAVDDGEALAVALALDQGDVHVIRSTGAEAPTSLELDAASVEPLDGEEAASP